MITFKQFEKLFKEAYFISWYDALAKRDIRKTVHWLFYFDGKDFDLCPVETDTYEFDEKHLYCFNFNFVKDFPLNASQQIKRMHDLLSYDEMRKVLLIREEFISSDKFVDDDLDVELLKNVTSTYFEKYKILFNQVIEEMYQGFKVSDEYRTFIYQIKDMFEFTDLKKIKDNNLSIFDMMNLLNVG